MGTADLRFIKTLLYQFYLAHVEVLNPGYVPALVELRLELLTSLNLHRQFAYGSLGREMRKILLCKFSAFHSLMLGLKEWFYHICHILHTTYH